MQMAAPEFLLHPPTKRATVAPHSTSVRLLFPMLSHILVLIVTFQILLLFFFSKEFLFLSLLLLLSGMFLGWPGGGNEASGDDFLSLRGTKMYQQTLGDSCAEARWIRSTSFQPLVNTVHFAIHLVIQLLKLDVPRDGSFQSSHPRA